MKKRLHSAHLGYDNILRRARELLYWPGMAQDIKQTAEHCEACQRMKPHNQKEMLRQHSKGQSPWVKAGIDLFELDGRQHLVTVDYFSTFIEVNYLTSTTAKDVINFKFIFPDMVFHPKSSLIRALSSPPLSSTAWSTSGALFTPCRRQVIISQMEKLKQVSAR